jgi:hypothetical protein
MGGARQPRVVVGVLPYFRRLKMTKISPVTFTATAVPSHPAHREDELVPVQLPLCERCGRLASRKPG